MAGFSFAHLHVLWLLLLLPALAIHQRRRGAASRARLLLLRLFAPSRGLLGGGALLLAGVEAANDLVGEIEVGLGENHAGALVEHAAAFVGLVGRDAGGGRDDLGLAVDRFGDLGGLGAQVVGKVAQGGALAAHPFMSAGLTRIGEVAQRILDSQAKLPPGDPAFRLLELYDGLHVAIFSELKSGKDIDLFRRNLQREYVSLVAGALVRPSGSMPADARSQLRAEARRLRTEIAAAQTKRGYSPEAKAHLAEAQATLDEALKASLTRQGV